MIYLYSLTLGFLFFLLTSLCISAQTITWQRTYGEGNIDYGYSITQTEDEGYIAVGRKRILTANYAFAMRLNKFGDTIWIKYFGGFEAKKIITTSDGNYVLTTFYFMIKIDADGNVIWQVPSFSDKIIAGKNGELYAIRDLTLRKYDVQGEVVWNKDFTKAIGGYFVDVSINSSNELMVVGNLSNSAAGNRIVLRTDLDGIEVSRNSFYWSVNPAYIIPVDNNGFTLSGSRSPHLAKFDSAGNMIWDSSYSAPLPEYYETFHSVKTFDGGYALAGYYKNENYDFFVNLLKIDSDGRKSWSRLFGFGDHDEARFVQQTTDSGFVIIGFRDNFNLGDIYVIKTDRAGNVNPVSVASSHAFEEAFPRVSLYPNYPNPFNSATKIRFSITEYTLLSLRIVDMKGNTVHQLDERGFNSGDHEIVFTANGLPSGTYFCILNTPDEQRILKLLVLN